MCLCPLVKIIIYKLFMRLFVQELVLSSFNLMNWNIVSLFILVLYIVICLTCIHCSWAAASFVFWSFELRFLCILFFFFFVRLAWDTWTLLFIASFRMSALLMAVLNCFLVWMLIFSVYADVCFLIFFQCSQNCWCGCDYKNGAGRVRLKQYTYLKYCLFLVVI